ncbi:hypothetical protein K474DRAFT_1712006 [Panus rudis PR-1116 ss-1]|nr:hypothetical protein K474DRAFT_1712006 [Panus rudis PR-1116 ss-1]
MASYASVVSSTSTAGGNKASSTLSGNGVEGVPYAIQRKAGPPQINSAIHSPIQRPSAGTGNAALARLQGSIYSRQTPHLRAHSPLTPYYTPQTPLQSVGSPNFATIHGFNCNNSPTFATFNNTPTIPIGIGRNEDKKYPYSPAHLGGTSRLPELSEPERAEARKESVNALIGLGIYMPSSSNTTTTTTTPAIDTPPCPPLLPTRRKSPLRIETILDDDVPLPPRYVSSYPPRSNARKDISVHSPGVPCMPMAPPASDLPTPFASCEGVTAASPFTEFGDMVAPYDAGYEKDDGEFTFSPFSTPCSPMPTAAEFLDRLYPESSSSATESSFTSTSNQMTTLSSSSSSSSGSSLESCSITDEELLLELKAPMFDPDYTTKPAGATRNLGLGLVGDAKFIAAEFEAKEQEAEFYLPSDLFFDDFDDDFDCDYEYETGFSAPVIGGATKEEYTIYETSTGVTQDLYAPHGVMCAWWGAY